MPFGIYIHLPYCITKCPYCDFNSYGTGGVFPETRYTEAVLYEIDNYIALLKNRVVDTVFFGGGTPSLFSTGNIEKIIDRIRIHSKLKPDAEISLELNPKTVDRRKIFDLKQTGVNRLSVGVQSFSQRKLDFYGRIYQPVDIENVLEWINEAGFGNFNIDLIYGSMNETISELDFDIKRSLDFNPTHISAYCLTIEDGTEFGRLYKSGKLKVPGDKMLAAFMEHVSSSIESNGYENYEISNFSKPGYKCRHNLLYWRSNEYLGLGAGAHSHLSGYSDKRWGVRWFNYRSPDKYINCSDNKKTCVCKSFTLSREESLEDRILMGMRLKEGIRIDQIEEKFDLEFNTDNISNLVDDGYLELENKKLHLTGKGWLFANEIILRICRSFC